MVKQLESDINFNNISQAYFFECVNEEVALREAKAFSEKILERKLENNPDFQLISSDEKSIKVDQVRDFQKDIYIKPLYGKKKIYLIYQANKLNESGQNCLLKTLEEPPEYITIILIASSIYSVLPTVRSRVKKVKIDFEAENLKNGKIKELIDTLSSKDLSEVLISASLFEQGNILDTLHEMSKYCDECIQKQLNTTYSSDIINNRINDYSRYIKAINTAETYLSENVNFNMVIDNMLINMKG